MKQLKTLLASDPEKFKEVTATIAQKLEEAAKSAAESGDTRQAAALNDMAAKFTTASETGTMPELKPGHGGPPPGPPPDSASESDSSSTSSSTSSSADSSTDLSTSTLSTELAALLAKYTQQLGGDPMSTLSGILDDVFGSVQAS